MDVNIGKGITLTVDPNSLPANALEHIIRIGLRNVLMDSHASITTDEADYVAKSRAVAEKKLEALMSGEVRVASTREGDPVRAEAVRIASDMVKAAIRKAGKKLADYDTKVVREKAVELVDGEKHGPAIMARAKANVAARKELAADVEVEL